MRGYQEGYGQDRREESGRGSAMRIMDALSGVDEELLERCQQKDRAILGRYMHKPVWQLARAWAAALCLVAVGAVSWGGYQLTQLKTGSSGAASDGAGNLYSWDEERIEVTEEMSPEGADSEEAMPQDMNGKDSEETGSYLAGKKEIEEGGAESESREIAGATDENKIPAAGSAAQESSLDSQDKLGAAEIMDLDQCAALRAKELTLEEARSVAELGGYVPTVLPRGYAFENAYRNLDVQEPNLTVAWDRGMDFILLSIRKVQTPPDTVDISREETYDERLYPVPRAETVPQEYRESVDNPVFAIGDLSLEIIKSRVMSYQDIGDTDTPRGNFCVLYPDGILVRFNGRGTPEEIWEMFSSIGE